MPELGGSYFTFSDENNYLIWSFLAECHTRGWLYKGHDSMPWCARCGTGISQHEMTEGYADREDPGLTVKFPLLDRPGEALLVWTTTPWTLTSNVAAAVGEDLRYVKVRQGEETFWLGRGTLKHALVGDVPGSRGEARPRAGRAGATPARSTICRPSRPPSRRGGTAAAPYEHRVVTWDEVGEEEGTGIVHIAPGCGAEDFALGKKLGLPMIAPLDENGVVIPGFGPYSGRDVRDVADPIVESLKHRHRFYRLETITHRYPHCWRCGTPLVFRLVDEWYVSMGPVYDKPREQLTAGRGRRQPALPDHGGHRRDQVDPRLRLRAGAGLAPEHARLDDQQEALLGPGAADLRLRLRHRQRHRQPRGAGRARRRGLGGVRGPHAAPAVRGRGQDPLLRLRRAREPASRDVGNPWLDAGIVPFSTMHYRSDPEYWKQWFPADFVTESFPGQFRNWFYSLLAMSTVLRRETPFKTLFGYALVFGEDGRQMHKSWGNAIEFDEAAERMGVDVMRWMFATARPEDNINFGWHAADEARRRLLVLWNVYSFFVTYARLAGWEPKRAPAPAVADTRPASIAGSCREWPGWPPRSRRTCSEYDALDAARAIDGFVEELSTWYLRRSREALRARRPRPRDRAAAFATLHAALVALARITGPDPAVPGRVDVPEPGRRRRSAPACRTAFT